MLNDSKRLHAAQLGSEIRWRLEMAILTDAEHQQTDTSISARRILEAQQKAEMLAFAVQLCGVTMDEVIQANRILVTEEITNQVRRNLEGNNGYQRVG